MMINKERRQQVTDREMISEDTKQYIQDKSDDRCVWCGKKVFLGYQGTVDHFIPIKKGGTNDPVNLVLMCRDCNQKKGSRIFPINVAASYLKEEHAAELGAYFEDFVAKYDYISRGNLMASDVYEMFFLPSSLEDAENRAKRRGKKLNINLQRSKYLLKRAYPEDEAKIVVYFTKYLKKYDKLDSPEAATQNIKFWMRFGSIYYIEKNGDIAAICCTTVNKHGYITFDLFVYYSTMLAWTMANGIVSCLSDAIMDENDLPYLPISFNMLNDDELSRRAISNQEAVVKDGVMCCKLAFVYNYDYIPESELAQPSKIFDEGVEHFRNFIGKFHDIEDDIMVYLYQNNLMDYSWMASEIIDRDFFDEKYYRLL